MRCHDYVKKNIMNYSSEKKLSVTSQPSRALGKYKHGVCYEIASKAPAGTSMWLGFMHGCPPGIMHRIMYIYIYMYIIHTTK